MTADRRLRLIQGGNKPRKYHERGKPQQWVCNVCERDIGVATSSTIRMRLSPFYHKGRLVGGRQSDVCAHCFQRGKHTLVT